MATLFEWLDSINFKKENLMVDKAAEKEYEKIMFMIEWGLSQHIDNIMIVEELNKRYGISPREHYLFLLNTVRKRRRFGSWAKKVKHPENVQIVSDYYNCSYDEAFFCLQCIDDKEVERMKTTMDLGGQCSSFRKTKPSLKTKRK